MKRNTAMDVPHFRQSEGFCGASSLRSVLSYWGADFSEEELAELSGSNRDDGVEAPGILQAARSVGFGGFYHDDAELDDVKRYLDLGLPVIVDWWSTDEGHYSVVTEIDDDFVHMVDPYKDESVSRVPIDVFDRVWFDFKKPQQSDLTRRRLIIVAPTEVI